MLTGDKFLKWSIGRIEIFQIVEVEAGGVIQSIIRSATSVNIREIKWLSPHFADEGGKLKAQVQCFLIKSGNRNILIDSCNGNDKKRTDLAAWSNLRTGFLEKLKSVSVAPEDIDIAACTHLHCDHVGWNTKRENGIWVPTFPKAKYLFARREYDYWARKPEKEIADDKAAFDDSVAPIVKARQARLVGVNHRIDRYIKFISSPGHTPHHTSVAIEAGGQKALISGDFLHHPCQVARPEWSTDSDTFPGKAEESRRRILGEIAERGVLLIGSHFADPVAGRVVRSGYGYAFKT